jgi:hypothetical protein
MRATSRPEISSAGAAALVIVIAAAVGCDRTPPAVEVVISVAAITQPLVSATVIADYSRAGAELLNSGGSPACAALPPDVSAQFSADGGGRLLIEATSERGFSGPLELAVCRMSADVPGTAASNIAARITVTFAAATDTQGRSLGDREPDTGESTGEAAADATDPAAPVGRAQTGERASTVVTPPHAGPGTPVGAVADSLNAGLHERSTADPSRQSKQLEEREREGIEARRAAGRDEAGLDDGTAIPADDPDAEEGDENDPDVRRATPAYDVYIDAITPAGVIGTLTFDVRHTGSTGGWEGAGSHVACKWDVGTGVCSDIGAGRLRCSTSSDVGFGTPAPIVTCTFRSSATVATYHFDARANEAKTVDGRPVAIDLAVTSVLPR